MSEGRKENLRTDKLSPREIQVILDGIPIARIRSAVRAMRAKGIEPKPFRVARYVDNLVGGGGRLVVALTTRLRATWSKRPAIVAQIAAYESALSENMVASAPSSHLQHSTSGEQARSHTTVLNSEARDLPLSERFTLIHEKIATCFDRLENPKRKLTTSQDMANEALRLDGMLYRLQEHSRGKHTDSNIEKKLDALEGAVDALLKRINTF